MDDLEAFLTTLSKPRNTGVMKNPYRQPELLGNLRQYLRAMLSQPGKRVLLVGEALGFKGGKLTGIPFSSGTIYQRFDHPLLQALGPQLQIETLESENTATIVWDYLSRSGHTPLFWNAYPFHPHPKGQPNKNRAPTAKEVQQGNRYLRLLAELYRPEVIAGVGGKGQLCARRAFPNQQVHAIRHPSYGGKADFIRGMESLYSAN
ncbi:MAG: uracil-DNA glycosylase [Candidatus Pelagadaptatus aseana]|uniref:uracil-DNA glycosylase family protein n=1 Tax=Candidatus Pelagadaptatus aseana TaxID=3120508 RepID=UPI0039B2744E